PAAISQRNFPQLADVLEALPSILCDRLQHREPVTLAVRLYECLVDERLQFVKSALAGVCADGLEIGESASSYEDGHAPEQALLRLRQEGVAPVDRGAQRLLPFGSVARAGPEDI